MGQGSGTTSYRPNIPVSHQSLTIHQASGPKDKLNWQFVLQVGCLTLQRGEDSGPGSHASGASTAKSGLMGVTTVTCKHQKRCEICQLSLTCFMYLSQWIHPKALYFCGFFSLRPYLNKGCISKEELIWTLWTLCRMLICLGFCVSWPCSL